jgi:hypothetical protein
MASDLTCGECSRRTPDVRVRLSGVFPLCDRCAELAAGLVADAPSVARRKADTAAAIQRVRGVRAEAQRQAGRLGFSARSFLLGPVDDELQLLEHLLEAELDALPNGTLDAAGGHRHQAEPTARPGAGRDHRGAVDG